MSNWWYNPKTTKWQIMVGTIIIAIIFLGTFSFLDTYEFETWKYSGFSKSIMGILMGTVALGVITGIIIIFQSIVSMDREKNQKIFSNRLELYRKFTKETMTIIGDDKIDENELALLKAINMEVLMIASPETYKKWYDLYKPIAERGVVKHLNEEDIKSGTEQMYKFINSCRKDLEINQIDTTTLESVIQTAQKGRASYSETVEDWLKKKKINQDIVGQFKEYQEYISSIGELQFKYPTSFVAVWVGNVRFALIYLNAKGINLVLSFQSFLEPKKNEWEIDSTLKGTSYKIKNVGMLNEEMKALIKKSYELARQESKI